MMLNRTDSQKLRAGAKAPMQAALERVERIGEQSVPFVLAKITGSTPIAGTSYRWQYTWEMAEQLNDSAKTMQSRSPEPWYSGICFNAVEGMNTSTVIGPGILVANIPAGFFVKPVEGFVLLFPHRLTDGTERWLFCVPNAIDGDC